MNIGQAAKISGLTVKTVRYYDNIGLVKAYQSSDNQYRVYSKDDIAKLQFIAGRVVLVLAYMNAENYSHFIRITTVPVER